LHVIELRRAVVKIARRYFDLPQSERIQIVEQDVAEFFDQPLAQRVDMVFSDIYGAEGMDMQYFQPWYIEACARLLNDDGWLIMNCWDEHRGEQDTLQALTEEFAEVYTCTVSTGNWIIFASKRPNTIDQAKLKMAAKEQSKQLGFSVTENLFKLFKVFPKD
jgi:spermidine synthase